jgi:hypothetical protein
MKIRAKKLNLRETWVLYKKLKPAFDKVGKTAYLIDGVESLVNEMTDEEFVDVIISTTNITRKDIEKMSPINALLAFIRGMKKSGMFEFAIMFEEFFGDGKSS